MQSSRQGRDGVGTFQRFSPAEQVTLPPSPLLRRPHRAPRPNVSNAAGKSRGGAEERAAPCQVGKEKGKEQARLRSSSEFPCVSAEHGCRPTASRTGDARPRGPEQASPCQPTPEAGTDLPCSRCPTSGQKHPDGGLWEISGVQRPGLWDPPSRKRGTRRISPELKGESLVRIMR